MMKNDLVLAPKKKNDNNLFIYNSSIFIFFFDSKVRNFSKFNIFDVIYLYNKSMALRYRNYRLIKCFKKLYNYSKLT